MLFFLLLVFLHFCTQQNPSVFIHFSFYRRKNKQSTDEALSKERKKYTAFKRSEFKWKRKQKKKKTKEKRRNKRNQRISNKKKKKRKKDNSSIMNEMQEYKYLKEKTPILLFFCLSPRLQMQRRGSPDRPSKETRDVLPLPFVRGADASIRPLSLGSWLTFDPEVMFIYKCIFLVVYWLLSFPLWFWNRRRIAQPKLHLRTYISGGVCKGNYFWLFFYFFCL